MRTALRRDEKILLITKKHWIVLGNSVMLLLLALFFLIIFPPKSISLKLSADYITVVFFIIASTFLVYSIYERKYNIWVVTNHRIIDEWGVLNVNTKESLLDKINNVACKQTLAGRMMDYGDIEIQTAAEQGATLYTFVTGPKVLHEIIVEASEAYSKGLFGGQNRESASGEKPSKHEKVAIVTEKEISTDEPLSISDIAESKTQEIADPRSWRRDG